MIFMNGINRCSKKKVAPNFGAGSGSQFWSQIRFPIMEPDPVPNLGTKFGPGPGPILIYCVNSFLCPELRTSVWVPGPVIFAQYIVN